MGIKSTTLPTDLLSPHELNTQASRAGLKLKQNYPILTWSTGGDFNFVALHANFVALYANLLCNQSAKLKMIEGDRIEKHNRHPNRWKIMDSPGGSVAELVEQWV